MHRRALLLISIGAASVLAAPLAARAAAPDQLRVVATITILGDMVEHVGAGRVALTTLIGPDGDAHAFEPTPADVKTLRTADLVVVNGLGLEGWLDRLIAASGYKGPVVVASAGVAPRQMEEEGATVIRMPGRISGTAIATSPTSRPASPPPTRATPVPITRRQHVT
jgi:zinc/manganese transport system substrate-binding protein